MKTALHVEWFEFGSIIFHLLWKTMCMLFKLFFTSIDCPTYI